MKKFLKTLFATFLALLLSVVFLVLLVLVIVAVSTGGAPDIEDGSWLVFNLHGGLPEYAPPAGIVGAVSGESPESVQRVLENLEKVRADDRIEGVIFKMSTGMQAGTAAVTEIRDEIKKVREGGKKVLAYAESLDRSTAYLAAACDEIYAPIEAYIWFTGYNMTSMHVKGAMDKLGVKPNVHKIKDYKSAAELVLREDMSNHARENREWLLDDLWENLIAGFQEDRGLSEEQVVALMEQAVLLADEAKEAGLIDEVLFWDQLEDRLTEEDEELKTVSSATYGMVDRDDLDLGGDKVVAVVHAQGTIAGRKHRVDPLLGIMMGYEDVVADLKRAADDEDVVAIVFRVDSGGGDSYGSGVMGHMVKVVSEEKPVVVSMVDVAASGGYTISYQASRVLADPVTITGSIGSISGKFNLSGLYDKVGLSWDHVTRGPMARFWDDDRDFTEEQWRRFVDNHWDGVNLWMSDIAEHRGMTFEEVEKVAHGRAWTGMQAVENGLVDELGGFDRALEVAKELAGVDAGEKVSLVHYPEEKGLMESLLGGDEEVRASMGWILHRYIHEDMAETRRLLEQGYLQATGEFDIR
jgi:protease-4